MFMCQSIIAEKHSLYVQYIYSVGSANVSKFKLKCRSYSVQCGVWAGGYRGAESCMETALGKSCFTTGFEHKMQAFDEVLACTSAAISNAQ